MDLDHRVRTLLGDQAIRILALEIERDRLVAELAALRPPAAEPSPAPDPSATSEG